MALGHDKTLEGLIRHVRAREYRMVKELRCQEGHVESQKEAQEEHGSREPGRRARGKSKSSQEVQEPSFALCLIRPLRAS